MKIIMIMETLIKKREKKEEEEEAKIEIMREEK